MTIVLNRQKSRQRQRFSLAHEIGHVLLEQSLDGVRMRQPIGHRSEDARIEKACDAFAAELLMPREAVEAIAASTPRAKIFEQLERRLGVSTEAVAYRLLRVAPKPLEIMLWESVDEERKQVRCLSRCGQKYGPLFRDSSGRERSVARFASLAMRGGGAIRYGESAESGPELSGFVRAIGPRPWARALSISAPDVS